jgi:hypothetical protein
MKSIHGGKNHFLRTVTISRVRARFRRSDKLKETAITDVVLSAAFAAIVALYVVMFAALYQWSRYAPIFPSNAAAGSPIGEVMPL